MVWSWYYLIPIGIMLIVAAVWLAVFFMSYKNTKNVKTAIAEAKETIEAFKGDTNMASLKFPAQKAETEEVTTTPAEPAKAATEAATFAVAKVAAATAPAVAKVAAATETAVTIENNAAETPSYVNNFYRAIEAAIEEMTDETEIKKLLNKLASKLT